MPSTMRILSIDGGGIRGIVPGQVLVALEAKLRRLTGRPDFAVADAFDMIAGTSTGGILTCLHLCPAAADGARPRFSAEQAVQLYLEHGHEIFDVPLAHRIRTLGGTIDEKHPARGLEHALERYLGNLRLSQLLKPCLIPSYDIENRRAFFFASHDALKDPAYDFRLRDVARATSAAPTYFECATVSAGPTEPRRYHLVDGGVFANNPALCAYAEARTMESRPTAKDIAILSLGTGDVKRPYDHRHAKNWGALQWVRPVIDIMMSGVAETVDYQLRQMYDAVGAPRQYLRIQPELLERNAELDDASARNLGDLRQLGIATGEKHDAELEAFAGLLLAGT